LAISSHVTSTCFTSGGQTTGDREQDARRQLENLLSYLEEEK